MTGDEFKRDELDEERVGINKWNAYKISSIKLKKNEKSAYIQYLIQALENI